MKVYIEYSEIMEINNLCFLLDRFIDFEFSHKNYIIKSDIEICETSNNEIKKFELFKNKKLIGNVGVEYNGDLIFYVKGIISWDEGIIDDEILNKKELLNIYKMLSKIFK
jgi:hypothetical protein